MPIEEDFDTMSEVSDSTAFAQEVRQGNENLVKVSLSAAQKISQLIDREKIHRSGKSKKALTLD